MKKSYIITAAVIVVLILLILPKINSSDNASGGNAAIGEQSTIAVDAYIAKPGKLQNFVNTSGTILANEEVELRSEVPGKITELLFKEGSKVKKGDLLVKINDSELQAELLKSQYVLKLSEEKEYRQRQLLAKEAISQEEYDNAKNEMNVNKAQVVLLKAQIAKTEITAPFDGRIGLRNVSVGSYISASTDIASLQNLDPIKIDFSIPEKYSSSVNVGDGIEFQIAGTNKSYYGKVYALEPRINNVTRTLQIRAYCSNSDGKLLPGAFADVKLVLKNVDNALMVPTQSIVPILKGQKLYLYKSGKVMDRVVDTGIRTDTTVQITSGISPYDTVITSGILQVQPGMPVTLSRVK